MRFAPISDLRMELSVGSFDSARGAFDQQLGDLHEIVGEYRSANKLFDAPFIRFKRPMPPAHRAAGLCRCLLEPSKTARSPRRCCSCKLVIIAAFPLCLYPSSRRVLGSFFLACCGASFNSMWIVPSG
jgi:hypothetical protein